MTDTTDHASCSSSTDTDDVLAVAEATSRLITAVDRLLDAQGHYDPTWLPLYQARAACETFARFHPTSTVATLVAGLDLCTASLDERADWENNS